MVTTTTNSASWTEWSLPPEELTIQARLNNEDNIVIEENDEDIGEYGSSDQEESENEIIESLFTEEMGSINVDQYEEIR